MRCPLWRCTTLIRSKNASPFNLTIDVFFGDEAVFDAIVANGSLSADRVAGVYGLSPAAVQVMANRPARAIKINVPRPVSAGHRDDTDLFGGQFHSPLVELEVEPGDDR